MDWLMDKIVLGIIVGVISNFCFLTVLWRLKPRIEISPTIAKGKSTVNGQTIYRFKVVNKTRNDLVDIRAELHLMKKYQVCRDSIVKSKRLSLKQGNPIVIEKFRRWHSSTEYAFRFLSYEDIEKEWADFNADSLRLRIFARNAFWGVSAIVSQRYDNLEHLIKEGDFAKGYTFEIFPGANAEQIQGPAQAVN